MVGVPLPFVPPVVVSTDDRCKVILGNTELMPMVLKMVQAFPEVLQHTVHCQSRMRPRL
jgi:hypothetical protein